MNPELLDEWVCRATCSYYKPDRTEQERCQGYALVSLLAARGLFAANSVSRVAFDPSFRESLLRQHVCEACPFLVDGCDFVSQDPPEDCLPCGGLIVLSALLGEGIVHEEDVRGADLFARHRNDYLRLTADCSIKRLERDFLYHVGRDELYEINEEALQMLLKCDGSLTTRDLGPDPGFLDFCVREHLLEFHRTPFSIELHPGTAPLPSLRYLEWLVTDRCNLSCAHCYLGDAGHADFPVELIRPLLEELTRMQGLRILVSGGEPTLYRHFDVLNELVRQFPVRAVLLTNGVTLDDHLASRLNFHEVQISLDGMEMGHDAIRGKGAFARAVRAMKAVRNVGLDLSVATMIHKRNLEEWPQMSDLIMEMGAREWNVDYPCKKGRWEAHPELAVDPETAAEKMRFGFGGSYHGTSAGWTCGRHLVAVLPTGDIVRCGLYPDRRCGSVSEGLARAWARVEHIPIGHTKCALCSK
ncbi:MAG: radical SAM protein, partial [Deltaproteobacteria bacterium]|nr:radical SAM protein [Deltaproteobacteria bacterium]